MTEDTPRTDIPLVTPEDGEEYVIREYPIRHPGENRQVEIKSTTPVRQAYQDPRRWRYVFTLKDTTENVRTDREGVHAFLSYVYAPADDPDPAGPEGYAWVAVNGGTRVPEFTRDALMEHLEIEGFGRPPFIPERDGDPVQPQPKRVMTDGSGDIIAYRRPDADVSPLFCPDCEPSSDGPFASEPEALTEADMDEFTDATCAVCKIPILRDGEPVSDPGLYERYDVRKNGEPVDGCFVLDPEDDPAAREALAAYADATDNQQLETDLNQWLDSLESGQGEPMTDGGKDIPTVPGAPNPGEAAELMTDPDLSTRGLMAVDGEDLPPDRTLGRMVRTKLTMPGGYVKPDPVWKPRRLVVVDKTRPELIPDALTDEPEDERREWIGELNTEITINLLAGGDDGELGEMVRERLMGEEKVFNSGFDGEPGFHGTDDPDVPRDIPGYYDPANGDDPRPGEQRAWLVVGGS